MYIFLLNLYLQACKFMILINFFFFAHFYSLYISMFRDFLAIFMRKVLEGKIVMVEEKNHLLECLSKISKNIFGTLLKVAKESEKYTQCLNVAWQSCSFPST